MQNLMGIINDSHQDDFLGDLTAHRSLAAVPFGGRYRIIDFPLSSMSNSGIENVGILLHTKYRALLDHLGPGKEWNLDRKSNGLFFLPPIQAYNRHHIFKGDIENFLCNIDYLYKSSQQYVLISRNNIVHNIDYNEVYDFHLNSDADITVIYQKNRRSRFPEAPIIKMDENRRIIDMSYDTTGSNHDESIVLGSYLLKKDLLIDIIKSCESRGEYDLVKNGFIKNLEKFKIYGYPYQEYLAIINSLKDYYHSNMDLLNPEVMKSLFFSKGTIHTKVKDEASSKIMHNSSVKNTLMANGSCIEGKVENSILFRGVTVQKDVRLVNCIAMQKSTFKKGAYLKNAIIGKEAVVTENKTLIGEERHPLIIKKRKIV